ncbi:MAG: methyltransferase domain-containing protein [Rhizobiales bacterium]|nr:methyltransferase domain-containing protein [Hyphomicrobiales bacterium]
MNSDFSNPHAIAGEAPSNCLDCEGRAPTVFIIDKFSHADYGHSVCKKCGLTFDTNVNEYLNWEIDIQDIREMPSEDEYRRMFIETSDIRQDDDNVYAYFEWEDNEALKVGVVKHVVDVIARHENNSSGMKILDLGCGSGFTTIELAKHYDGINLTAVDPSPTVKQIDGIEGINAIQGTLDSLKFENNSFDIVIIIGNLMLHNNPTKTLRNVERVLKPNGLVIFDFKNSKTMVRRVFAKLAILGIIGMMPRTIVERAFAHMRFGFTRQYVRQIGAELGFQELEQYSKPPRLLEYSNKAELQTGVKGLLWRLSDHIDAMLDQRAWIQMVWRLKNDIKVD